MDYKESVRQLTAILFRTFELFHKHGGFEKGIYLSGGVDSTLMAVLSREILDSPIHTYTLYDSENAPDLNHARRVARAIGSEHHEFLVTALDYLQDDANQKPCVVILDLNMPKMNGIEFLKIAKADEILRRIPVVVLTTSKDEWDRFQSFDLSAAGYIIKPADYKRFLEAIRTVQLYWTLSESPNDIYEPEKFQEAEVN